MSKPYADLSLAEVLNLRAVTALNENALTKRVTSEYLRLFAAWWIHKATEKTITVDGLDRLRRLSPETGVIMAANHRSFFDFYVLSSILFRNTQLMNRIYFPVRSTFFYDTPAGFLVNGLIGGFSMYPPIFREKTRKQLNEDALHRVEELVRQPGALVGYHPEGTRGKGPDPYELLPPQAGIGRLVHRTRVPVLPAFIVGLGNDFRHQLLDGVRGKVDPIYACFGDPVELDDLLDQPATSATYHEIAVRVHREISALGQQVKALDESRRGVGVTPPGVR